MKRHLVLPLVAAFAASTLPAAEPPPTTAAVEAKPVIDLDQFKTAEELWNHVRKIEEETPPKPKSREELVQNMRAWLERQQAGAKTLLKRFPDDPRRWDAKVLLLTTGNRLQQVNDTPVDTAATQKEIGAILAAADASPEAKGEAAFLRTIMQAQETDISKPESVAALQTAVTAFLDGYAENKHVSEIANMQIQILDATKPENASAVLQKLASSKNEGVATMAKAAIAKAEKQAALKTKPIELKFTATDGQEIDLEKMRGKVVLVDFWASWCGPCIAEMPSVVSTYKELHPKGFEIIGISLDQDKTEMEAALKKHEMAWSQHFDGKGWQNTISSSFGIDSIPATWLVDKKGMVREMGLRGDALKAGVEKLLKE